MRHVRYTNIVPCDYTNILMQPNATLSYLSMLLSILLVDDETDNGGKVVACHHNATLVSSIIILSLPVFFLHKIPDLKVNCGDGGVATSAGVDYTGS